jgi:hypothetical protein
MTGTSLKHLTISRGNRWTTFRYVAARARVQTRSDRSVTWDVLLSVVRCGPGKREVVHPGGSQRGSQAEPRRGHCQRFSKAYVAILPGSMATWAFSGRTYHVTQDHPAYIPRDLPLLSAQSSSSGGKPTRTAGPPGTRSRSGVAELRITSVSRALLTGSKSALASISHARRW